jgi:hypothetical protein
MLVCHPRSLINVASETMLAGCELSFGQLQGNGNVGEAEDVPGRRGVSYYVAMVGHVARTMQLQAQPGNPA